MPTSPFERTPSADQFSPDSSGSYSRRLNNIRPAEKPSKWRSTASLDKLSREFEEDDDVFELTDDDLLALDAAPDSKTSGALSEEEEASRRRQLAREIAGIDTVPDFLRKKGPESPFEEPLRPTLTAADRIANERADARARHQSRLARAHATSERRTNAAISRIAEDNRQLIDRQLAKSAHAHEMYDSPATHAKNAEAKREAAISPAGRERLDTLLSRYDQPEVDRIAASERVAAERAASIARHNERLEAANRTRLNRTFDAAERIGAHTSELPARQAAIRAEALHQTNSAPLIKQEKHPSYIDDEILEEEREANAWELAQKGHRFQNPEDAAAALRGFARATNKPTFAERADEILRDHQIAKGASVQESFVKPSNGRVEDLDSMMSDPSLFEEPTADRRANSTFSPDLAGMLDDMDAALGRASKHEAAANKPQVEEFEATPYIPGPSAQEIINTKKGELDKARQDLHAWKESLRIIQEDITKDEEAFERMHGAGLAQTALRANSFLTRARMRVENVGWKIIGQKERAPSTLVEKFKRDNGAAVNISARIAEQMERIESLENEIKTREQEARGEFPEFNEEKDRERGRFRAAAMRGGFRRRPFTDHAPEVSLPIGDIGGPVGSKKLELNERHSVLRNRDAERVAEAPTVAASAATFESGGFDPDEAQEMAAELNADTAPEATTETLSETQKTFTKKMERFGLGDLGKAWGERFKNDPHMLQNIMEYVPLFNGLEGNGPSDFGGYFNRLKDLPLKNVRELIEKEVNAHFDTEKSKGSAATKRTRLEAVDTLYAMYTSMREDDPNGPWKMMQSTAFKYGLDTNGRVKTVDAV